MLKDFIVWIDPRWITLKELSDRVGLSEEFINCILNSNMYSGRTHRTKTSLYLWYSDFKDMHNFVSLKRK